MRNQPGEKITPNISADLFNKAFGRVTTIEKVTKGFEVTGIFPDNPDVFHEEDFAPAENLNPTKSNEPIVSRERTAENKTLEKGEDEKP